MYWLDRRIVSKQLDIMPTYHYGENQGKLIMQSQENGQKPQFGQFFLTISRSDIPNVSLQLKVHITYLVPNFRPKTKTVVRAVFEKNISVWFWANLEAFSRISPDQDFFFRNVALSLFCLYSPLTSCKKSENCFRENCATNQPTNQPTNQLLPTAPILLLPFGKKT